MERYQDFGATNKSTLGELLYQFFRYYAFELDFEEKVVSLRLGSLIAKAEKGWHQVQDNRLCVEEPFNTTRNLANTADDTSMRGIHLELRRAFQKIVDGRLDQCCEQYVYPPDEPKYPELFVAPTARPVIPQLPNTPRGGKLGGRGGRNAIHLNRNNLTGRRSSNPASRAPTPMLLRNLPFQMTTQELQLQAQHQQHLLHDQLFQQFQYLQLQEQELRARLNQQRQRSMLSHYQYNSSDENADNGNTSGSNSTSRGPVSAPLYQQRFAQSPFLNPGYPVTGIVTNPSSPHLSPALPDNRRFSRRTSLTQSAGGGPLRAHSQPARMLPTPLGYAHLQPGFEGSDYLAGGRRSSASSTSQDVATGYAHPATNGAVSSYESVRRPAEYVGYYVGQSPSLLGYPQSANISPLPSHIGLAISNGGLSPRIASSSPPLSINGTTPLNGRVEVAEEVTQYPKPDLPAQEPKIPVENSASSLRRRPLVVDGSINSPRRRRSADPPRVDHEDPMTFSTSTSEDLAFDTPSSSDEHSQDPREVPQKSTEASRLHTSQVESASDMGIDGFEQAKQQPAIANGGEAYRNGHPTLEQNGKPAILPWSMGRQLSAVQEVRTPSPGFDRGSLLPASPTSIARQQLQSRSKKDSSQKSSPDIGTLSSRTNGIPTAGLGQNGAASATQTSWQTQKKRRNKKKTVKSENDAQGMNESGGDSMPLDESQRKGG